MDREKLREVVLVKAIEESDSTHELISQPERRRVTVDARLASGLPGVGTLRDVSQETLGAVLANRAAMLLRPVLAKHPVFEDAMDASRWPSVFSFAAVPIGLAAGFGMRWISDWDRINLMHLSITLLIVWNLIVYVVLAVEAVINLAQPRQPVAFWTNRASRFFSRRLSPLITRTSRVDLICGAAIAKFLVGWSLVGSSVISHQLRRMFHIAASCAGVGLIIGFYMKTWDHSFVIGWDSSHSAGTVKTISDLALRPFTTLIDVQYPTTTEGFQALNFKDPRFTAPSALPWVHLLSLLICSTVVLPRLLLAGWETFRISLDRRSGDLHPSLLPYVGTVLGCDHLGSRQPVAIFPYDMDQPYKVSDRLTALTMQEFGPTTEPQLQAAIARSHETQIVTAIEGVSQTAVGLVVLCLLSAKPSAKHHGSILAKARDRVQSPALGIDLKLFVDEQWPKPKMMPAWAHAKRISQRRKRWKEIAKAQRVRVSFIACTETEPATVGADVLETFT